MLQYRSCGIFNAWDRSVCIAVTLCGSCLGRVLGVIGADAVVGVRHELVISAKQQQQQHHPAWSLLGRDSVRCRDRVLIGLLTCLLDLNKANSQKILSSRLAMTLSPPSD